jgi:hypothetical protein
MPTTNSGMNVGVSFNPGLSSLSRLTGMPGLDVNHQLGADPSQAILTPTAPQINYGWYLVGVIVLLVVLKYASQHERSEMQPALAGIGVWNFIVVGIMASLFIVVFKIGLNKYPITGLTQIANAI